MMAVINDKTEEIMESTDHTHTYSGEITTGGISPCVPYYQPLYYYYPYYVWPPYNDGFKDWLKGFLEGKDKLNKEDVKIIKEQLGGGGGSVTI